jgi:hypothetical protein
MSGTRLNAQPARTVHSSSSVIGIEQAEFARVIDNRFEITEGWPYGDSRDAWVRGGEMGELMVAHNDDVLDDPGGSPGTPVFTRR